MAGSKVRRNFVSRLPAFQNHAEGINRASRTFKRRKKYVPPEPHLPFDPLLKDGAIEVRLAHCSA
ncbi:hypothetical protein, partial [Actinomadura sp. 3N407]|uniref:hypothetical protein n=1 Tax=Actinomadura sp. 3N407 TaxID=3457423 RepID=UPI003FCD4197